MFGRLQFLRPFDEPDELSRIVNQHRKVLRADAERPALVIELNERYDLRRSVAKDAVHSSIIDPGRRSAP